MRNFTAAPRGSTRRPCSAPHPEHVAARRDVRVEGRPPLARLLPLRVERVQPVAELDALRRLVVGGGVFERHVAGARRQLEWRRGQRHPAAVDHPLDQDGRRADTVPAADRRWPRRGCRQTTGARPSSSRRRAACPPFPSVPRRPSATAYPSDWTRVRPAAKSFMSDLCTLKMPRLLDIHRVAGLVLEDRERRVVEEALLLRDRRDAVLEPADAAAERAHPQHAVGVLVEREDVVVGQAVGGGVRLRAAVRGSPSSPRSPPTHDPPALVREDRVDRRRDRSHPPGERGRCVRLQRPQARVDVPIHSVPLGPGSRRCAR